MNNYYLTPKTSPSHMGALLYDLSQEEMCTRPLVFLCIGSDRCTGDSLGPIIGYKLERLTVENVYVYGTLKQPVHALNLESTIENIYSSFDNPYIIAIDASLGKEENVGLVTIGKGPLVPGLGVSKALPSIGDLHITGIVNTNTSANPIILQTTRLSRIMDMADFIFSGISCMLFSSVKVN